MRSLQVNNNADSADSVCKVIWPRICEARRVFSMQASVRREKGRRRKAAGFGTHAGPATVLEFAPFIRMLKLEEMGNLTRSHRRI